MATWIMASETAMRCRPKVRAGDPAPGRKVLRQHPPDTLPIALGRHASVSTWLPGSGWSPPLGAAAGPPLATPTRAGRSSRSCSM